MGAAQSASIKRAAAGLEASRSGGRGGEMDEWAGGLKKILFVFTVPQLGLTIP